MFLLIFISNYLFWKIIIYISSKIYYNRSIKYHKNINEFHNSFYNLTLCVIHTTFPLIYFLFLEDSKTTDSLLLLIKYSQFFSYFFEFYFFKNYNTQRLVHHLIGAIFIGIIAYEHVNSIDLYNNIIVLGFFTEQGIYALFSKSVIVLKNFFPKYSKIIYNILIINYYVTRIILPISTINILYGIYLAYFNLGIIKLSMFSTALGIQVYYNFYWNSKISNSLQKYIIDKKKFKNTI